MPTHRELPSLCNISRIRNHFHDLLKFLYTEINFASVIYHKLNGNALKLYCKSIQKFAKHVFFHLLLNNVDYVNIKHFLLNMVIIILVFMNHVHYFQGK